MNIRDLMIWASTQPDDMEVMYHVDGQGYAIGHVMAVPEWKVAYLGLDKDELAESLAEEMATEAKDNPDEADTILAERDVFLQALEKHENVKDLDSARSAELEGDPCCDTTSCAVEGGTPITSTLYDRLPVKSVDPAVGVM